MQWTHTYCCTSHCMAQECVGARHVIYMVVHVVRLSVLWLSVPHFVLFCVFLLSLLLLLGLWAEPFPACGRHWGAIYHWHSAKWGVWSLGRQHASHGNPAVSTLKNLLSETTRNFDVEIGFVSTLKPPRWAPTGPAGVPFFHRGGRVTTLPQEAGEQLPRSSRRGCGPVHRERATDMQQLTMIVFHAATTSAPSFTFTDMMKMRWVGSDEIHKGRTYR